MTEDDFGASVGCGGALKNAWGTPAVDAGDPKAEVFVGAAAAKAEVEFDPPNAELLTSAAGVGLPNGKVPFASANETMPVCHER